MARAAALILIATHAASRSVEVSIRAPWPTRAVSPLLEAAEFLAGEGRGVYWSFVEAIGDGFGDAATKEKIRQASSASTYDSESHEEMAAVALDAAEKRLDGLAHALLRMALAVRTYAPRLEAHRSLASQAPTCNGDVEAPRAVVYGPSGSHVACSSKYVSALVAKAAEQVCTSQQCDQTPRLLGSETPYQEGSDVTIELITDVTSPLFKEWHAACSSTEATYFLRHASHLRGSSNQTHLQAFGANLDIKDLERGAVSETASKSEERPPAASSAGDGSRRRRERPAKPRASQVQEPGRRFHGNDHHQSVSVVRRGRGGRRRLSGYASSKAARPEARTF